MVDHLAGWTKDRVLWGLKDWLVYEHTFLFGCLLAYHARMVLKRAIFAEDLLALVTLTDLLII